MGNLAKVGFRAIEPQVGHDLSNGADADTLLWNQEVAILDTTELICDLMKEAGVSRSDLAQRMRKSKGYITQLLDGSRNMTIRTVSDIFTNLGHEFRASCKARQTMPQAATVVRFAAEIVIPHGDAPAAPTDAQFFSVNNLTMQPQSSVANMPVASEFERQSGLKV